MYWNKNGKESKIFYHLIYDNTALEVQDWMRDLDEKATETASKIFADESPLIPIMNALNSKTLKPINEGGRGKVWILDGGGEGHWECMKTMTKKRAVVRPISGFETLTCLGFV
jgi:hypothetical protein